MKIIGQYKDIIVPFDESIIEIVEYADFCKICCCYQRIWKTLGVYSTIEKAKVVLQMIIEAFINFKWNEKFKPQNVCYTFQIPQDDEVVINKQYKI